MVLVGQDAQTPKMKGFSNETKSETEICQEQGVAMSLY